MERCLAAYEATSDVIPYVVHDFPSCGEAWLQGATDAAKVGFDYLHLTADDLEPHDGWLQAAIETVDKGLIPAPMVYRPDGTLESAGLAGFSLNAIAERDWQPVDSTTVPFLTTEMWEAIGMIPIHYCTDLWVSNRGRLHGWDTVIRTPMRFTHYTAQPGRNYARADADTREYMRAIA
jgi:hypothetical protein